MTIRLRGLFAVAVLASTACGPTQPLTLNMRNVSITVPRMITPAAELVEAAIAPLPAPLPPPPPVRTLLPARPAPRPTPVVVPPPDPCPDAGPLDVPAVPASRTVNGIPVEGTYEQSVELEYTGAPQDPDAATVTTTVQTRVTALGSETASDGQEFETWSVERVDAESGAVSVEVYRLVHPGGGVNAGIWLVGMAWEDPVRGDMTWQPSGNGIWLLPSPVVLASADGIQYFGLGTDPQTYTTLYLNRNVTGQKRVDVCGELVDTFTVEMFGTLTTTTETRLVEWTIQFATAHGGFDVEQMLRLSSADQGFSWARTARNTTVPEQVS